MDNPRLHMRPRLGTALSRVSDDIVPMASRAIARRSYGSTVAGVATVAAMDPIGMHEAVASESIASDQEQVRAAVSLRVPTQPQNAAMPAAASNERPALRLVKPEESETDPSGELRASSGATQRDARPAARDALLQQATAVLNRRAAQRGMVDVRSSALVAAFQGSLTDKPQSNGTAASERRVTAAPHAGPAPSTRTTLTGLPASVRAGASIIAATPDLNAAVQSRHANVVPDASPDPFTGLGQPSRITAEGSAASAPRPTSDVKDSLAALLIPALPAEAPGTLAQSVPAETDFEFETRVRAALEAILSEDMLRHGFIAPEVL